jgi:hypothetical protein
MERAQVRDLPLTPLCRAARALGLAPSVRLYPAGVPVRDAAQLPLLRRLESTLAAPLRLRREVPLPIRGDPRAWDAAIDGDGDPVFIEAETHLRDVQAFERRVTLKVRDDPRARVVLLVATRSLHNRRLIAEHREALRPLFPLDSGAVLRSLRAGRRPPTGGIVLV